MNYKIGTEASLNDSSISKMNFSHAASKFIKHRKNIETQLSATHSTFRDNSTTTGAAIKVSASKDFDKTRLIKNVKDLRAVSQERNQHSKKKGDLPARK